MNGNNLSDVWCWLMGLWINCAKCLILETPTRPLMARPWYCACLANNRRDDIKRCVIIALEDRKARKRPISRWNSAGWQQDWKIMTGGNSCQVIPCTLLEHTHYVPYPDYNCQQAVFFTSFVRESTLCVRSRPTRRCFATFYCLLATLETLAIIMWLSGIMRFGMFLRRERESLIDLWRTVWNVFGQQLPAIHFVYFQVVIIFQAKIGDLTRGSSCFSTRSEYTP